MALFILYLGGNLSKGLVVINVKQGVISKTVMTMLFITDGSLALTIGGQFSSIGKYSSNRTGIVRPALFPGDIL